MPQLTEHRYTDRPARYYIDGRRVSRESHELATITARIKGQRHECFSTRCKETGNGRFHRINHSLIGGV